ncbi:MAG: amino acid ABC transporter ATP-binding protein [Lachnospiraceae bacterium]|nr:amino acid ABC transporter ATP-binding protein [Lachnospiraceae bacterium]
MIDIVELNKYYGDHHVLKNINLHIDPGEVVVIIGPSGSGKSTLLRCINYLEEYQHGYVTIGGENIGRQEIGGKSVPMPEKKLNKMRQKVGMVFQSFNLFYNKTVCQNITMAPMDLKSMKKSEAKEKSLSLLEMVGLKDKCDVMPARLSGGQKQRVAIARALAMDPEIMLFDEPTSALDPEMVGEVLKVMKDLANSGMTMVIVTHEMNFARTIADKIVVLEDGSIIESGSPEQVFEHPQTERTRAFVNTVFNRDKIA